MSTLDKFITSTGLRMSVSVTQADSNPSMSGDWPADHYRCTLVHGRSRMTVHFSKGMAHQGRQPELAEVLDCLANDASGYENSPDFADFCAEYGYDEDSRKAEKTFKIVARQSEKLKVFLGDSAYQTLLWNTERQ